MLLKKLDERGFTFFTNFDSRKGREITANPRSAVFPWHALERQVRVEGTVEVVTLEESDAYFATRPLGSRLGAWLPRSTESPEIPSRAFLERQHVELMAKYPDGPHPVPAETGAAIACSRRWCSSSGKVVPSRLHDRIRFTRAREGWRSEQLSP